VEIDRSRCLPIAEDFHSLQGEGQWVGTPMHFIRLAGCSVGQPEGLETNAANAFPLLKTGNAAWRCHTYDGREFFCDTDFHLREWANFAQLLDDTWETHICLTGGEPLMHGDKLRVFAEEAQEREIKVHIETSGTIFWFMQGVWISVSPKLNFLPDMIGMADEIKLLVDEHFDLGKVPASVFDHERVYVQPINDELALNMGNFKRCMDILHIKPQWRMSVQMHKLVGLR
jgi:7-carboxy-7-deazaguanine synthase